MTETLTDEQALTPSNQAQSQNQFLTDAEAMTPPAQMVAQKEGAVHSIARAFGEGLEVSTGPTTATGAYQDLGFSQETSENVNKTSGPISSAIFNGLIAPAAASLDAMLRTVQGYMITGPIYAATQALTEAGIGGQEYNRKGAEEISEAILNSPFLAEFHLPEFTVSDLIKAKGAKVLESDKVFRGVEDPLPEQETAIHQAQAATTPAQEFTDAAQETKQPDIHTVARNMEPEVFEKYDTLAQTKDDLRTQLSDLSEKRTAELDAQIQEIQEAKQGGYGKLQKLIAQRDELLASDTPEMTELRGKIQEADYAMRDLAPQVSDAYRRAEEFAPKVEESPVEQPPVGQEKTTQPLVEQPKTVEQQTSIPTEAKVATELRSPEMMGRITEAVAAQLKEAGRPAEESSAAAQLVAEHYATRAERFGGKKGTAEEMFNRDMATIKAGKERAKVLAQGKDKELNQFATASDEAYAQKQGQLSNLDGRIADETDPNKIKDLTRERDLVQKWLDKNPRELNQQARGKIRLATDEAKATITLMKNANASTFIHEIGHHWLDELMRDAADEAAPADVIKDYKTVRDWLGLKEDEEITTKMHEKFARGFERYLMEGTAPSKALGNVFAKFKQWLNQIYQTVNSLKSPINDDIRDVFDRLLTNKPERTIVAPERELSLEKNIKDEKLKDIFSSVPKLPQSLSEWLADNGGLKPHGDLSAMDADKTHIDVSTGRAKPFVKKLINENGKSLDEAALAAEQAGYFPEKAGERPTEAEFLDKLREDINGKKQYSDKDSEALKNHEESLKYNAEIDKISNETGISNEGKSTEQFWDEVAEHYNHEKRYNEDQKMAEDTRRVFEEMERKEKEYMESRGEAWEPPKEPEHATLEDLENERKQELAATNAKTGPTGAQQPTGTPGLNESSQTNVQQGRSNFELAGRADEGGKPTKQSVADATGARPKPTEQPTNANATIPKGESNLVDKAGNIRLDNLNTPEDVNQVLRETAAQNNDFIGARRGVISAQQQLDLADALGMSANDLNVRKIGQAFNAEQIIAARKLLIQSATELKDIMTKAADGTDADVMAYAEAKARHSMIQEQVSGLTAEAGRALGAFRKLEGSEETQAIGDFLKQATGKDLFQLKKEAQLGMKLDTPQKVSKFIQDSKKASFGEMLLEYWVNGLISGPATHTTYMMGNTLLGLWKAIPETAVASLIGKLRGAETVKLGEVGAQLKGAAESLPSAVSAAAKAAKTGLTTLLPGEEVSSMAFGGKGIAETVGNEAVSWKEAGADAFGAIKGLRDAFTATGDLVQGGTIPDFEVGAYKIPVGSILRAPQRAIAAIHSFFRTVNYSMEKAAIAYRTATDEGLNGNDFAARIGDITTNPTEEIMEQARGTATNLTLMGQGGKFTQAISRLTNVVVNLPVLGETRLLKFIDPFVQIGSNVIDQAILQRTPIGLLSSEIRADLAGANGAASRDFAASRIIVGTALGLTFGGLASEGLMSGSGPSDPRESATWRMLGGNQPYSIKIGDMWYDIHRLGPLGMLAGISADMYDVAHAAGKEDLTKVGSMLVHAITQNILDESFMRGPADLIKAVTDSDRYGDAYIRNFAASFTPFSVGMSQMARAVDPYARQTRTVMDAIKAKIPFISEGLYPRRDIWGEPIANKDVLGVAGFSAIYESQVNHDPVNQRMLALGVFPSQPERKIRGVQLNEQQYDDYSKIAGKMAKLRLDSIVGQNEFAGIPESIQIEAIKKTIESSRETARKIIMMQNPDIIKQATEQKLKTVRENNP